ncbi:MAG: hypothetical protein M3Q45_11300, partial [Chloroflexota bacterium]|nr:hypothetical protein [Chloroflexota bacterium]
VWTAVAGTFSLLILMVSPHRENKSRDTGYGRQPYPVSRIPASVFSSTLFFILFTLFCTFMATKASEPLWNALPFLNLFEWPFRWHGFTAVGLSWLCALTVFMADYYFPKLALSIGATALLLLIGSALVNLYPDKLPLNTFKSTPADVVRFETRTNAIGTTSLGEFDPIWSTDSLGSLPPPADYEQDRRVNRLPTHLPAGVTGVVELAQGQTQQFRLQVANPATLTLDLRYFPGWQATANGQPIPLQPHPGSGLIDVRLPAGEQVLRVTFGATPLRHLAGVISAVAWISLALFSFDVPAWRLIRRSTVQTTRPPPFLTQSHADRPTVATLLLCIALVISVKYGWPGWFQLHSAPNQALAATTKMQADFGDQLRLLGVDQPPPLLAAGDTLTLVTYWRARQRLSADYALFLHLDDITGRTVAAVDQPHPGDIPTTQWSPNLYVRAPLQVVLPPTLLPIRYYLRVGLVDRTSGEWLAPSSAGADVVDVGQVWIEPTVSALTPNGPQALFEPTIYLRGVHYAADPATVTLYWQTEATIATDYTIFVHYLDTNGTQIGQSDAAPYRNLYPTSAWRPRQMIEDQRMLGNAVANSTAIRFLLIGLYDSATETRLPALDEDGKPLPDNALRVDITTLPTP